MTYLPVFFHNLKNYDMHALCRKGLSKMKHWQLKPIAVTKEKYVTLSAKFEVDKDEGDKAIYFEIRFTDSFQFLTASLDKLSSSLDRSMKCHSEKVRHRYQLDDDVRYSKGVFHYSYLDSFEKLNDKELPPIKDFFDTLSDSLRISQVDYARAQRAWRQFGCNTFNDYLKRYLELDCRLLADVFESFRVNMIARTCLDPANFITLPQFTFAAAFRQTKCDLLTDADMYEFFEDGIRGGMTFVNKHHVRAANPETGDPGESTYIAYWDENNLYGNALRQKLPCSAFEWLPEHEFELDWQNIDTEGEYGYVLKVDLEYPANIHDKTQDFPLAPESSNVTAEMFTPYMMELWALRSEMRGQSETFKSEKKLLMTCRDKKEYVVHFKLLKFYLRMGMRVTRTHAVVKFRQDNIFCDYIDENSRRRAAAKSEFEKDLYKLLNNALFGKTMENVRNRKDYKLRNTEEHVEMDASKPHYLRSHRFSQDLILNELVNLQVKLNKPIFIGQAVLDLSKLIMYDLRYNNFPRYEEEFGGQISVLGGDTDSLFCLITNIYLYGQLHPAMSRDGLLDSSNFSTGHHLFSDRYKAVLGCIKDELPGQVVREAVLLKPKCYSMITVAGYEKKTAKRVHFCVRQAIAHDKYREVFERQIEIVRTVRRFQTENHVVSTIQQQKWALSCTDTKRAWISANTSLPYGHYALDDEPPARRP